MKTFSPKNEDIERKWYVVDARNQILGRLASHVARILRGKHKPIFAPHVDVGDHVVIINAEKIRVTGKKAQQKQSSRNSFVRDPEIGSSVDSSLKHAGMTRHFLIRNDYFGQE